MFEALGSGAPAPWFSGAVHGYPGPYSFEVAGGRPILMLFAGRATMPQVRSELSKLAQARALFDDRRASFFGISVDPNDKEAGLAISSMPGVRWFQDYDCKISRLFGCLSSKEQDIVYHPHWLLLDRQMRIVSRYAMRDTAHALSDVLLLDKNDAAVSAPVLMLPRAITAELCSTLIQIHEAQGGIDSGIMRKKDGILSHVIDYSFKRRRDVEISQNAIVERVADQIAKNVLPMVERAFQFKVTRIERWVVACYDAKEGGHFRPHRDDTAPGVAHRKFACTINLNPGEYTGGDLVLPEYGRNEYRAALGGAVVFSASLLHQVTPVTEGRRYALLPFFYDEAGARVREQADDTVCEEIKGYRSHIPLGTAAD